MQIAIDDFFPILSTSYVFEDDEAGFTPKKINARKWNSFFILVLFLPSPTADIFYFTTLSSKHQLTSGTERQKVLK